MWLFSEVKRRRNLPDEVINWYDKSATQKRRSGVSAAA